MSCSVVAAGVNFFCLRMALCPLQPAHIPVRVAGPLTRVSVAGSTACLAVLGPGLTESGLGSGAKSWARGKTGVVRGGRAVLTVVSLLVKPPLCLH